MTLLIRGPPTYSEKFSISLDRVAVKEEEVCGALLCVQDFFRSPHFTRRSLFSESGLTVLSESVAIADSITSSPVYVPWSVVKSASASQVIIDLCACWDRVLLRRRSAKDTSERWYHGGTPRIETASRPGVRISSIKARPRWGGARWVPASCSACSWSSWVKQNPFLIQQAEEKNHPESSEVATEIWSLQFSS